MKNDIISKINVAELNFNDLSDEELLNKVENLKSENLKNKKIFKKFLPEMIALIKEATSRSFGITQYDNQVLAALEVYNNNIVELKPGEGKTFVIFITAFLKVMCGQKVHVMVENDYLLQRDFHRAFNLFNYLGISVGAIPSKGVPEYNDVDKKKMYDCDIVYVHPVEAAFDFLKSKDKDYIYNSHLIIDDIDRVIATKNPASAVLISENGEDIDELKVIEFVKKYSALSGLADFALKEKKLYKKYLNKNVISIEDNIPSVRVYLADDISKTKQEKYDKIIDEVIEIHKYRCPVIVVTPNEEDYNEITQRLAKKGVFYKYAKDKNSLMDVYNYSQAGELSKVTIITFPSGIDIPMGGDPYYKALNILNAVNTGLDDAFRWGEVYNHQKLLTEEAAKDIEELGGIYTIVTEHTEQDDAYSYLSARRGMPGSVKFFNSLDDDFLQNINLNKFFALMNVFRLDEKNILNKSFVTNSIIKFAAYVNSKRNKIVK
jgi:preprotein translocase subunit SecA